MLKEDRYRTLLTYFVLEKEQAAYASKFSFT